ncbi:MAG: ribonuclease III [Hyphomonadaceae bacterium]|nr:ribonuclease III [Hyphomonadaceae bacterium]MBC6411836.1 ribonuclease III [Hyphomonadaceae bacterium]
MNPKQIQRLEARLGYEFTDKDLLVRSMTHGSYGDGQRRMHDNERLEFLGDRVLGLLTAEKLFRSSQDAEGPLARRLNSLVKKETCADVARHLGLGEFLLLSKSENRNGGRDKTSILGDACEAVIAAIYLDGGLKAARAYFNTHWQKPLSRTIRATAKDPKTELQERAATAGFSNPVYTVQDRTGPDHRPHFVVEVKVGDKWVGTGEGRTKKDAQSHAARNLLREFQTVGKTEL